MNSKIILVIGVIIILVIGVGAFLLLKKDNKSSNDNNDINTSESTGNTQKTDDTKRENDGSVVSYDVELSNYSFTPNILEAKAGDTVKIKLTNKDGMHDFVIDELDVSSSVLKTGEEKTIEFTIPSDAKSGTEYEFYCSVNGHKQMGMVGKLKIKN